MGSDGVFSVIWGGRRMALKPKKTVLLFLVVAMIFSMVSCSEPQDQDNPVSIDVPATTPQSESDEKNDAIKIISNNNGEADEVVYRVVYYSVNTKTLKLEQSVSAVKGGKSLDPMTVLGLVSDSLEDSSIEVSFDDAYFDQNGFCVIVFSDSIRTISEDNHELETLILDACGQSVLDNIDAPGVILRINDGAYVTEQYNMDMNDVYMDK